MDESLVLYVLSEDGVTAGIVALPDDDEQTIRERTESAVMYCVAVNGIACWDNGTLVAGIG